MKHFILLTLALLLSGCQGAIQAAKIGASTAAAAQCQLPLETRIIERKIYYEANGGERLLVGFCRDDPGFAEAVEAYLITDEEYEAAKSVYVNVLSGDRRAAIELLMRSDRRLEIEDGCVVLPEGKFCPNGYPTED